MQYDDPTLSAELRSALQGVLDLTVGEIGDILSYERACMGQAMAIGRALMAGRLSAMSASEGFAEDGEEWRVTVHSNAEVLTLFGPILVRRPLFRNVRNGPTRSLLSERAGLVHDLWTPAAAKVGALAVAEMPVARAEAFFKDVGVLSASKSSLLRLASGLSVAWENGRESHEEVVRAASVIPPEATTVVVSLDGVMVMMVESKKAAMKAMARAEGRADKGPAGFSEASVGVIAMYDARGVRLTTKRYARMPEEGKATTKAWLVAELNHIRNVRPDIVTMAIADGAANNWTFLETLGVDHELVDFYHTGEHLHRHVSKANGASTLETQVMLKEMRRKLLTVPGGAADVFKDMRDLRENAREVPAATHPEAEGQSPTKRRGRHQPTYFEMHHDRMDYPAAKSLNLPIGSGVTESTCKFAVTDRMRRTGMRWKRSGGQAVMTLRALLVSGCFDAAWQEMLAIDQAQRRVA
jgi:hypothetical protein